MSDWDISELEWDFAWLEEMNKSCPFCNSELAIEPGKTDPGVATAHCECGYSSTFTPPRELDPHKDAPIEIVL